MDHKRRKKTISLAHRISTLMIFVSFVMITAFTTIQIRNQLSTITNYNAYRARLSSTIAKDHFENALAQAENPKQYLSAIKETLFSLKGENVIDDAWVCNRKKKKITDTNDERRDKGLSLAENYMADTIFAKEFIEQWFYPFTDKENNRIDLYIPLMQGEGQFKYLAKASFSLGNMQEALRQVYIPVLFMIFVVIASIILIAMALSKSIIHPLVLLNRATKEISGGKLQMRVDIKTGDEIEELGHTFNQMAQALVKMKERAENANPLTKLPGNVSIHDDIEQRIREGKKFVVIHSDLDNFKAFNDKYGLANGDIAILLTANLFRETIEKVGNPDDFLGHEGGDDYVLITTPDKVPEVTSYFIRRFEEEAPKLYTEEDRKRGHIIGKNRQGVVCEFGLMSISLSGVSNKNRILGSYTEVTNLMPDLKEKSKSIKGCSFVIDE